ARRTVAKSVLRSLRPLPELTAWRTAHLDEVGSGADSDNNSTSPQLLQSSGQKIATDVHYTRNKALSSTNHGSTASCPSFRARRRTLHNPKVTLLRPSRQHPRTSF